jgi:acyl-CoA synthetase (AMP-forming)/AMP-acid ligase II
VAEPARLDPLRAELPYLRTVLAAGAAGPVEHVGAPVDAEAPARIMVSSGSEAEPKMVAYSHNAMAGGRGNYLAALYGVTRPVRALVLVPLSSSYGSLGIVTLARHGGTVVLLERFEAAGALRAVTAYRPTHVFGVPTMLRRMTDLPAGPDEDHSALHSVVGSAALLNPATVRTCRARFGCPVVNVYGSSDGVNCHTARPDAGLGRPDPAVAAIRIGAGGEIQARGPMTPLCYVDAPELDARHRLPGGWVRTGDRGFLDTTSTLHLTDRLRPVVLRGGWTVSPAEVETQLSAHPDADLDLPVAGPRPPAASASAMLKSAASMIQKPARCSFDSTNSPSVTTRCPPRLSTTVAVSSAARPPANTQCPQPAAPRGSPRRRPVPPGWRRPRCRRSQKPGTASRALSRSLGHPSRARS